MTQTLLRPRKQTRITHQRDDKAGREIDPERCPQNHLPRCAGVGADERGKTVDHRSARQQRRGDETALDRVGEGVCQRGRCEGVADDLERDEGEEVDDVNQEEGETEVVEEGGIDDFGEQEVGHATERHA